MNNDTTAVPRTTPSSGTDRRATGQRSTGQRSTGQKANGQKAPGPFRPFGVRRFRHDAARLMLGVHREYGDVARFRVGPELMHQVAGPDVIKQVLHDADSYRRGRVYAGFELFFGKGSLTTDGQQWRTLRTTGQPFFRSGFLHPNVPAITGAVTDLLDRLEGPADRNARIDLVPEVMRMAFDVVTRVLCGSDLRHRAEAVIPAIVHVLSAMFPGSPELLLPTWLPGPHRRRLRATQAVLDDAVNELIDSDQDGRLGSDRIVRALRTVRDPDTDRPLERRQVMDELKTHLLAGHETTGCGLAWTMYEISRHPDVRQRLETELAEVLHGRPPSVADLRKLGYLRQVVSEALRLHPPIPMFPREPLHDIEIGGYRVPGGSTVFVSAYSAHHDPRHWSDPDTFDPDRFDPARPAPTRYSYLPFGGGQRRCIGAPLAELEIQVAVAMIVQRYRLTPLPGHEVDAHSLISLRPRFGLPMTIAHTEEER